MAAADEDFEEIGGRAGVRPFWSGTITFGLVSVPVNLFPATVPRSVAFRMVGPEGATVQRRYVCSKDGAPLDADDIVRGFEIEKGKFVVVTDDELEALAPRKSREIDLRVFVPRQEIDPMYYERAYFLTPAAGSNKAYRLLAEVMEQTDRAGIATFVMRAKEYLVAILAEKGILRAETLRFHDELREPKDVGLPEVARPKPAEVKKTEALIARGSRKPDFKEMFDDYAKRVEKLVAAKQKRGEDVIRAPREERGEREEQGGEVVDLLAVLRRSMEGKGGSSASRGGARAPRRAAKKASPGKATAKKRNPRSTQSGKETAAGRRSAKKPGAKRAGGRG